MNSVKRSKPERYVEWAMQDCNVLRYDYQTKQAQAVQDQVVLEVPVALVYNGISHAVMMASPADLEDFALGFSLSEGIIDQVAQLYDCEIICHSQAQSAFELRLQIASSCFERLKSKRRNLYGNSACGLCGIDSLQSVQLTVPAKNHGALIRFSSLAVQRAAEQLRQGQMVAQLTGASHAAASFSRQGEILQVREDVGRHNAMDKLIGACRDEIDQLRQCGVLLSSRASFELLSKAVSMAIPLVACISAPSSAAIALAQHYGITLCGFVRQHGLVVYSGELEF